MNKSTATAIASIGSITIAHAGTFGGHILDVTVTATASTVTVHAVRDRRRVRSLSFPLAPRRGIDDMELNAAAAQLITTLEEFDRDAMETFATPLGGWAFDYSATLGAVLDFLVADKKALKKALAAKKQKVA